MNNFDKDLSGTEKCVSCGKDIGVLKSAHVEARQPPYIEGADQPCQDCYNLVYGMVGEGTR